MMDRKFNLFSHELLLFLFWPEGGLERQSRVCFYSRTRPVEAIPGEIRIATEISVFTTKSYEL